MITKKKMLTFFVEFGLEEAIHLALLSASLECKCSILFDNWTCPDMWSMALAIRHCSDRLLLYDLFKDDAVESWITW